MPSDDFDFDFTDTLMAFLAAIAILSTARFISATLNSQNDAEWGGRYGNDIAIAE